MIRRPPRSTLFPYRRSSDLTRPVGISRVRCCSPSSPSTQPNRSPLDRKSTRLNSSHVRISYAVFCLKKKNKKSIKKYDHSQGGKLTCLESCWLLAESSVILS